MINLLLGSPGSGKSYEAVVYHIIPALKQGRKVITNLALNLEYFAQVIPESVDLIKIVVPTKTNKVPFSTLADYGDSWRHPEKGVGALYVIDECHKPLKRYDTQKDVEEWYAEARHELADVLLISQSYRKVSADIIDLVQLCYRVRKNTALGSNSSYVRKVQDGVRGEVVNASIRTYDAAYYPFYKSHTLSDKSAQEAFASDIKPIWRHWSVYGAGFFLLLAVYLGASGRLSPFPKKESLKPPERMTSLVTTPIPQLPAKSDPDKSVVSVQSDNLSHPFSKVQLHISGFIKSDTGRYLYSVTASQNGQRVFIMSSQDLIDSGYSIVSVSACAFRLSFGSFNEYVICDAPSQGVKLPQLQ